MLTQAFVKKAEAPTVAHTAVASPTTASPPAARIRCTHHFLVRERAILRDEALANQLHDVERYRKHMVYSFVDQMIGSNSVT
jgi:hypothetical protein